MTRQMLDQLFQRIFQISNRTKQGISLLVFLASSVIVMADEQSRSSYLMSVDQDVELCSNYREALIESSKDNYPICDRWFDSPSPPFVALKRSYLDVEDIMKLYDKVESFRLTSDQDYSARIRKRPFLSPNRERAVKFISGLLNTKQLSVWKLVPEVDIDNDGQSDPILVWRYGRCRGPGASSPNYGTLLLVLDSDGSEIDESKTEAIFGNPVSCGPDYYCPMSSAMTVFVYRGKTYYDAWEKRAVLTGTEPRLKIDVHRYSHGKVERLCGLIEEI